MNSSPRIKTTASLALMVFVLTLASPVLAAGITAKALLPKATAKAKKWQPDAALVHLGTEGAEPDGTVSAGPMSAGWDFTFVSPKTKKKILVMVNPNGEILQIDSNYFKDEAVGEFTMDSNKAMAAAVKNGLKTNNFGMKMRLEENQGRAEWRMLDDKFFYYVDANSGKVRKEKTTD